MNEPIRALAVWIPFAWHQLDDYRDLLAQRYGPLVDALDTHRGHQVAVADTALGYRTAACTTCDQTIWTAT